MCLTWLWYDKNMEANEYTEFEGQRYVNPTLSRDEQMAFIDNLRNTQTANNEQIQTDTYNLGTHIPMTQGGLATGATDPDSYFMKRYQTPQVDSQVATLKATAQAQALNDVLSNYQKQMKKRYNDAYKAAQKRAANRGGTEDPQYPGTPPDVDEQETGKDGVIVPAIGIQGGSGDTKVQTGDLYTARDNKGKMLFQKPIIHGTRPDGSTYTYWVDDVGNPHYLSGTRGEFDNTPMRAGQVPYGKAPTTVVGGVIR